MLLGWSACAERPRPPERLGEPAAPVSQRSRVLGAFLEAHWRLPVPPQGPLPSGWNPAEAALDPAVCGACHPAQLAQWQTSLHAAAFSPGFSGQLIEGELAEPGAVRQCQTCHAPLAEQQPWDADHAAEPSFDPDLRAQGVSCAACHVRAHRRYGPPRRPELAAVSGTLPHGGFEPRSEFSESRFCAPCHQFFDDPGVAGKPIENTFAEWQASPHAAQGRTCQSCHMPDRAHAWRGIHDPETVRAAVDVELVGDELRGPTLRASLILTSRDVGHHFPTYVTPRVFLSVVQIDARGRELPGSRLELVIGRQLDFDSSPWGEIFDTRVPAGGSQRLDYAVARQPGATTLLGRVRVDPDHHYRGLFTQLGPSLVDPEARRLIAEAERRTQQSSYVLMEIRLELGRD